MRVNQNVHMKTIKQYLDENNMGATELGRMLGYSRGTINERKRKSWLIEPAQGGFNFVNPRRAKSKIFESMVEIDQTGG